MSLLHLSKGSTIPLRCRRNVTQHAQRTHSTSRTAPRPMFSSLPMDIQPEVQHALKNHQPVVALESAIITHGLPQPTNLTTALSLERIVRSKGAVPATIGIIGGRVKVGMDPQDITRLSDREQNKSLVKVSTRDISPCIALKRDGGTTCSATLFFASLARIKVFATGGLGGVHRGGHNSLDISADLNQLSKSRVALVSAGVKSILDIGRTLEYLETIGVPVLTYGKTNDFPAFYSAKSGFKSSWSCDSLQPIAEMIRIHRKLSMSGLLVAVPIPAEHEAKAAEIQMAVEQAIKESDTNDMITKGNQLTPWLLGRVAELTGGRSIESNIALIENTASVGAKLAVEYANMMNERAMLLKERDATPDSVHHPKGNDVTSTSSECKGKDGAAHVELSAKLAVVGASALDIIAKVRPVAGASNLSRESTAPGEVAMSLGGVARNIAEAAHKLLSSGPDPQPSATLLMSPIGNDGFARSLLDEHQRIGMRTDGFIATPDRRTAVCNMVLNDTGSLIGGVADMDIIQDIDIDTILASLRKQKIVLVTMDANLSQEALAAILNYCNEHRIPSFFEPTSVIKSASILPVILTTLEKTGSRFAPVTFCSPNILELAHIYRQAGSETLELMDHPQWWTVVNNFGLGSAWRMDLDQLAKQPACPKLASKGSLAFLVKDGVAQMAVNLLPFFQHLVIKCGERGIVVAMRVRRDDDTPSAWFDERSNPLQRYVVARSLDGAEVVVLRHFPAIPLDQDKILNVTGAGDSLVGALCAGLVQRPDVFHDPKELDGLIQLGQNAAVLSLQSNAAVSPLLGTKI